MSFAVLFWYLLHKPSQSISQRWCWDSLHCTFLCTLSKWMLSYSYLPGSILILLVRIICLRSQRKNIIFSSHQDSHQTTLCLTSWTKGKKINQLKTDIACQLLSLHSLYLLSLLDCLLGTWLVNLINRLLLFPLSDMEKLELIEYWLTELVTARHCFHPTACSVVCARAEDELRAHWAAACGC